MEGTTDSIRALASKWSLAGDEALLNLLQTTHQRIVSKCREVNTKLDEMVSALDDTSINLQNVNNKFMALSNSQFIESRVFDDDADVIAETKPVQESPKPEQVDEFSMLKSSLVVLDNAHETAEILDDSDTDDSDVQISVVLKPKDAYAHRPLPYIIGSQAWKNKWHAGLVIEDSDSDSSTSRQDVKDMEQYSESEEEVPMDKNVPDVIDANVSGSSSSLHSSREQAPPLDKGPPVDRRPPAVVAAELAAWLGNAPPVIDEPEEDLPQPTTKTVYRPQKPVSSTIFSDEPPPMDAERYSSDSQEEDDIFAEINRKQPYNNANTAHDRVDDVFGTMPYNDYSDFKSKVETSTKRKATLFDEESEPELFVEKPAVAKESKSNQNDENSTKKPVGGISLFGSNKGTERIGAAILKRNQRKSSSSEHESDDNTPNTIKNEPASAKRNNTDEYDDPNNANAIFDNLFAKAKQAEQKLAKSAKVDIPVKEKPKPNVKDLFSDNIFDDIDDIFTSNIKIPTKEANKNAKSIFDDDDDDLFSDVAKKPINKATSSVVATTTTTSSNKKSIFDSDDDLFSDVKVTKNTKIVYGEESQINKPITISKENKKPLEFVKESTKFDSSDDANESKRKPKSKAKSIFDSDSDDDLFSNIKTAKPKVKSTKNSINIDSETETELFKEKPATNPPNTFKTDNSKAQSNKNSISINSEIETELFKEKREVKPVETLKTETQKVFQSPSLFEEDEIDDLFINANKAKESTESSSPKNTKTEIIIPDDSLDFKGIQKIPNDFVGKEETSDIFVDNNTKEIESPKPVVVDTKSYIIPKINEVVSKSDQLFDDNLLEDDLFRKPADKIIKSVDIVTNNDVIETSQESIEVTSESSKIDFTNDHNDNESAAIENKNIQAKSDFSNTINREDLEVNKPYEVSDNEKQDLIPKENNPIPLAAAFDNIFSEPPAFEKTKEVKKITNVNALFEDDSDDEALFFKKNDIISDEKPEIFTPSADFGIFNDEPPDLDADFTPIRSKNYDSDDDLFSSVPKTNILKNELPKDEWDNGAETGTTESVLKPSQKQFQDDLDTNLFSSPELSIKSTTTFKVNKEIPESIDELFSNIKPETQNEDKHSKQSDSVRKECIDQVDEIRHKEISTENTETKKIGKLNTKNFNINVQALVPGASPKKVPKERSDDSVNINKDIDIIDSKHEKKSMINIEETLENAEAKVVKPSFESKPDSGVLDNKLSKQRARIQVKRRPSTRRARHEAVRKSVIDIDDDTDNSSSFDEPKPKTNPGESSLSLNQDKTNKTLKDEIFNAHVNDKISKESKSNELKTDKSDDIDKILKPVDEQSKTFNIHNEIIKDIQTNRTTDEIDSKLNPSNAENDGQTEYVEKVTTTTDIVTQNDDLQKSPQSTTKVVYVLNDEDIFDTSKQNDDTLFSNNDDDLFKTKGIKTIGNTYKDTTKNIEAATTKNTTATKNENATNIESIKESSKKEQHKTEAKSLFDLSDDDDDLFGKSAKSKKVVTKSKLFESDSEDELFSGKKDIKKNVTEVNKKDVTEVNKKDVTEVNKDNVKEVKGSLFGDDDDDDLFGNKTKTVAETSKNSSTTRTTTSKDAARSTEIVFDDPLSMLDED